MPPPTAKTVSIPNPDQDGHFFNAYLARPSNAPAPAVLLLHEAYGLNDNMRELANRFAEAGYAALAVDLYSDGNRIVCIARSFYGLLAPPRKNTTARHVVAAFTFMQNLDGVDKNRVGAMGFCLGGSYALQLACLDQNVRAVSVVSGQNPRPLDALARACPIVGSYPERDFTTGSARKLDVALDEYKIPHEIKFYAGGIHSMFNSGAKNYSPTIDADAWQRTLAFFQTHFANN